MGGVRGPRAEDWVGPGAEWGRDLGWGGGGGAAGGGDLNWAGRSQGSKGGERPGTDSRRIGL